MSKPRGAVISSFGINGELETMAAFEMAGASADRVHVNRPVSYTHLTLPTILLV